MTSTGNVPIDGMTREEAMEILKLYRTWNTAEVGINEQEREILNERRSLLRAAMRRLQQNATTTASGDALHSVGLWASECMGTNRRN